MAKRAPKQWVYRPRKPTPPKIPAALKAQVSEKADALVVYQTLDECLAAIKSDEWFHP